MKAKEFDKLIKCCSPQNILVMYIKSVISLNDRQLDKVIKLKKGTEEEGHGGISFGKSRKVSER